MANCVLSLSTTVLNTLKPVALFLKMKETQRNLNLRVLIKNLKLDNSKVLHCFCRNGDTSITNGYKKLLCVYKQKRRKVNLNISYLSTFQPFIFKEERLHSVDVTRNMKIIFLVKCLYIVVIGSLRKTLQQMNTKRMKDKYKRSACISVLTTESLR